MKYYVYHGYVGPDHYDASDGPLYKLESVDTAEEVEQIRKQHLIDSADGVNPIFIVIRGTKIAEAPIEEAVREMFRAHKLAHEQWRNQE